MALRVVRGNRAEALLGALFEALPPADPFAPRTIVVGGHLVTAWLRRELALARGIAAGVDCVGFDRFVARVWGEDEPARAAGLVALDRDQLAAALASVLADTRFVARWPQLAGYLEAGATGDRAAPRRVQLATHVAELAWQYAQTRPDWMAAFLVGKTPGELAGDHAARWQAALVGEALARLAAARPGQRLALLPMLPHARRAARIAPPRELAPIAVFGMSYLQRAQLEALSDLAATTDVTVYLLDACEPLWDDVSVRARADAAADPLPLALWGRALRDTLGALVERSGGDVDDGFARGGRATALAALLDDTLERRAAGGGDVGEPGVTVLACPNARRELEVVAAEARARLDADPTLRAHEIVVWIASDDEHYLARAPSAFEAVRVPHHLIDAPLDDRGRIGEAVLALLELPTSAMTRADLLRVMTHPAVLAAHPHVDADDWIRWTERLGIAHGADAAAHAGTYLAAHPTRFHWDQGVRRLALGAFMVGDRGPVAIEGSQLVPEELRPEQHASAATFALLARSLCADAAWLATHEASLAEWGEVLAALVDTYFAGARRADAGRDRDDRARDVERVRSMLAGIAHVDLDGRRVGFREAREHAASRLVGARHNRGEPLAAGVMIAPLATMRAIPARIVFVVGLDERAGFSAHDRPSSLDARREPRAGDVSHRDRDRHAFLEALLGARERLYLSYVAAEAKSGAPLGPASVVLELADALAPYFGDVSSSRDVLARLTKHVPLHRWSEPGGCAREQWAVRTRDAIRTHLRARDFAVPDEDGMLALLADAGDDAASRALRAELALVEPPPAAPASAPTRPLSIANVRMFLESPVQAWAQAVLGLDELPDDELAERTTEPFHVERAARAMLLREVLAAQLRGDGDAGRCYDAVVADLEQRGQFPVGVFGDAARANDLRVLARWREQLGPIALGAATRIAFGRSHSPAAELLPALELELSGGRTVRLVGQTELLLRAGERCSSIVPIVGEATKSSKYHLRGALDHVVLAAAGLARAGHAHVLLGKDGESRRVEHAPWSQADARGYLSALVGELLDAPHGYLLPFDALVRALDGKPPARTYGDPTGGLGYGPIARGDGLDAPPDAAAIAQRRLAPLVERMTGDHSLGGRT